jgi:ribosomal protein S8
MIVPWNFCFYLAEYYFEDKKKISKEIDSNLSLEILKYLKDRNYITEQEYGFYLNVRRHSRNRLTKEGLQKKIEINIIFLKLKGIQFNKKY